jgi:hypothetical protein
MENSVTTAVVGATGGRPSSIHTLGRPSCTKRADHRSPPPAHSFAWTWPTTKIERKRRAA